MKILKAVTAYLVCAAAFILLFSFFASGSERGTDFLGYYASFISLVSGFIFGLFLKKSCISKRISVLCIIALLALSALLGYILGVINLSGTISTVMFTAVGCAFAELFLPYSRKKSTHLKSLHKL